MGFFDSFKSGAKDVFKGYDKVKLKEKITYDELYEIMKDETYSVGKPEITGSGLMRCIQFPAVDKYKIQIAITSKTITISKIYSGAGGLAKEIIEQTDFTDEDEALQLVDSMSKMADGLAAVAGVDAE